MANLDEMKSRMLLGDVNVIAIETQLRQLFGTAEPPQYKSASLANNLRPPLSPEELLEIENNREALKSILAIKTPFERQQALTEKIIAWKSLGKPIDVAALSIIRCG